MMKNAIIIGIGFLAFGLLGILIAALLTPHLLCASVCTFHYEALLVKYAIRIYGLISIGTGSLFVLIGAFGSAIRSA